MLTNVPVLLSGLSAGVILFQTAIIAPTVLRGLGTDHAGPFLRKVFPKFFVMLAIIGIINTSISAASGLSDHVWIGLTTFVLASVSYLLIPMTNRHRDEGNESSFKRLHRASVLMTVGMLIINLCSISF
jgi:hypothetical protein